MTFQSAFPVTRPIPKIEPRDTCVVETGSRYTDTKDSMKR